MKSKKLLNKTLYYYLIFGSLMILMAIPSYYYFYNRYYIHEIDEYLFGQKEIIVRKSLKTLKPEDISTWNKFNDKGTIFPDTGQVAPTIFITRRFNDEPEEENEPYRVLYSKVKIGNEDHILMVRQSIYEAKKIIKSATMLQLFLFIGLMIGFVIITQIIFRKFWNPFYKTLSDIEQFNIRNNEVPSFLETDIQEFEQLNNATKKLINNNLQAYKTQKEFTENASHEMQTPLAVFQSKLDILLQHKDLTKEQLSIMQSLYDATSRLSRMNKNLLLLAKIDNLQFLDTQALNMAETIRDSISFFLEQAEMDNIEIEVSLKEEDQLVEANRTLLESLINNLTINAIRHNIPNGMITILTDKNRLIIENTGIDKELNKDMLFRRFGRMNEKGKGSGLGLAIVKQICVLYNWDIDYTYQNGKHQFSVAF